MKSVPRTRLSYSVRSLPLYVRDSRTSNLSECSVPAVGACRLGKLCQLFPCSTGAAPHTLVHRARKNLLRIFLLVRHFRHAGRVTGCGALITVPLGRTCARFWMSINNASAARPAPHRLSRFRTRFGCIDCRGGISATCLSFLPVRPQESYLALLYRYYCHTFSWCDL